MTTVSAARPQSDRVIRDTRTFRRVGAAMLMPIGPLALAVVRLVLPYFTTDTPAALLRKITAAPGRQTAVVWLSLVLVFTLVPSVLAAGRVLVRHAPVLTTIAMVLLVPGFIALLFAEGDPTYRALVGVSPSSGVAVVNSLNQMPANAIADNFFVLAHIVGMILLGVAALRSRVIPAIAAWVLLLSQPLHLVFAVIVPNHALDAAAWTLTAVGLAFLARTALRTPNDEWDLPPIG